MTDERKPAVGDEVLAVDPRRGPDPVTGIVYSINGPFVYVRRAPPPGASQHARLASLTQATFIKAPAARFQFEPKRPHLERERWVVDQYEEFQ